MSSKFLHKSQTLYKIREFLLILGKGNTKEPPKKKYKVTVILKDGQTEISYFTFSYSVHNILNVRGSSTDKEVGSKLLLLLYLMSTSVRHYLLIGFLFTEITIGVSKPPTDTEIILKRIPFCYRETLSIFR